MPMTERITGIDEMIERLGALPHQVDKALQQAGREASAAGYKKGLRVLAAQGLDQGTVIGYSRWFSAVQPDGTVHLWLGQDPLRRVGAFEDTPSGRRQRATVQFPPGAQTAIQAEVTPVVHQVFKASAEREIKKQIVRG